MVTFFYLYPRHKLEGCSDYDLREVATKLHEQFMHADSERQIRVIKDGNIRVLNQNLLCVEQGSLIKT